MGQKKIQKNKGGVIYQTKNGAIELRGDFTRETIWATQAQIAQLFDVTPQNITLHLNSIFKDKELDIKTTCKESLQVQIEDTFAKLLAIPEDKTPPVIVLEETKYVNKLQDWLAKNPQGNSQNGVYFVKTRLNNPTPSPENVSEKDSWKVLIDRFTELGVKKILMGGMQLDVSEFKRDWTHKGPWVAGCIGIALSHLSKDKAGKFEVELSALTQPRRERNYYNSVKHKDGLIGGGD